MKEEWVFWCVFQKYPQLLLVESDLSLSKLMKIYSIIQMNNDYEKAKTQYDIKVMEFKKRSMQG